MSEWIAQHPLTQISKREEWPDKAIVYPEEDGEPMAETDTHRDSMADTLIYPLKEFFREDASVYVSGNLLLYYEEGNPKKVVAPDVFVVRGVGNHQRRIYKLWEEGKAPEVVFEVTSGSTRQKDLSDKRYLYEQLGVQEYFLFDPLREYLLPPLQGFRLDGFFYSHLKPTPLANNEWELVSQVLGLRLHTQGERIRLYDAAQGGYLRSLGESEADRRGMEVRLKEAEAEIARLQALLGQNR